MKAKYQIPNANVILLEADNQLFVQNIEQEKGDGYITDENGI